MGLSLLAGIANVRLAHKIEYETRTRAQFQRLKTRRGPKKAVVAVAASILTAAYFILRDGVPYHDLGPDYFDRRHAERLQRRCIRQLEQLGLQVTITPASAAA